MTYRLTLEIRIETSTKSRKMSEANVMKIPRKMIGKTKIKRIRSQ